MARIGEINCFFCHCNRHLEILIQIFLCEILFKISRTPHSLAALSRGLETLDFAGTRRPENAERASPLSLLDWPKIMNFLLWSSPNRQQGDSSGTNFFLKNERPLIERLLDSSECHTVGQKKTGKQFRFWIIFHDFSKTNVAFNRSNPSLCIKKPPQSERVAIRNLRTVFSVDHSARISLRFSKIRPGRYKDNV